MKTNADAIREMSNDKLVSLLVWGVVFYPTVEVPDCDEWCEYYRAGCANSCPKERREKAVREWLEKEV